MYAKHLRMSGSGNRGGDEDLLLDSRAVNEGAVLEALSTLAQTWAARAAFVGPWASSAFTHSGMDAVGRSTNFDSR
jgi:hypothetical protein